MSPITKVNSIVFIDTCGVADFVNGLINKIFLVFLPRWRFYFERWKDSL